MFLIPVNSPTFFNTIFDGENYANFGVCVEKA